MTISNSYYGTVKTKEPRYTGKIQLLWLIEKVLRLRSFILWLIFPQFMFQQYHFTRAPAQSAL